MPPSRRQARIESQRSDDESIRRGVTIVAIATVAVVVIAIIIGIAMSGEPALTQLLPREDRASAAGLGPDAGTDPCGIFPPSDETETEPPDIAIDSTRDYAAFIETPKGTIAIDLFANVAPQTVNNFMFLVCHNFYRSTDFYKVLPGFIAQGGDPHGTGKGGTLYYIPDEFSRSGLVFDRPGLLAMALPSGANTASSQFFITLADTDKTRDLTGRFTIFGEVADEASMAVVRALTPRDPEDPATAENEADPILKITIRQMN